MLAVAACSGAPSSADASNDAGAVVVGGGTGSAMGMPANPENPLAVVAPPPAAGVPVPLGEGDIGGGTGKALGTPANPVNRLAPGGNAP